MTQEAQPPSAPSTPREARKNQSSATSARSAVVFGSPCSAARQWLVALAALCVAALLLACGGAAMVQTGDGTPRWACPSPTPLPYGPRGPVKLIEQIPRPTASPFGPVEYDEQPVFYAEWEQEYGARSSGPPFPSPTPYGVTGTSYVFGQRVSVEPVFALVTARSGAPQADGQALFLIDLAWVNPTGRELPVDYGRQVFLSAVAGADGRVIAGRWTVSTAALAAAGLDDLPRSIPPGDSRVTVPALAPAGRPETVELRFVRAAPAATPAPNQELRQAPAAELAVRWSNAAISVGPPCADPGALTAWGNNRAAWGRDALPVAAPPGASRVVQLALAQVGKRYVWGAEGPESFDCSGLMQWSYGQIGLHIPRTAQTQRDGLRPVAAAQVQPGDLMFFSPRGSSRITHVAMIVGDLDNDGRWDIVHAMSPGLGVRVTHAVFESRYYGDPSACTLCIAALATVR